MGYKNKEDEIRYRTKYILEHKEQKKKYDKIYRLKNKEKRAAYFELYRKNNKEKIALSRKIHRLKYHKQIDKRNNEYTKTREKTDISFKILRRLRHRVNMAVKNGFKKSHTNELLGCSIEELKIHLEKQFKPGMSWNNYTYKGWHIDHIIPCAAFDLSKEEEQRKCFNYKNLQPLWWNENLKKGDKIEL